MQSMKFRVVDKAHNEAIQKALFAQGFKWGNYPANTLFHPSYQVNFLYAEPEGLCHGELQSTFDSTDYPEYLLYRGELVEAGGSNPTFDEQQEVCVNATSRYRIYVGEAVPMPGTDGFTLAVFKASDVPVGTKLYA